ncbi:HNH endonuclease [Methylobacterium sp. J-001]|uniref:HNH endonuclease n=1 Tax=Methylobacterium sp. J-001 TaxID=2836609 RepID=UPI001FB886D5|nr:HNH endonuclease [Methylobacterium sp. J-001]MCJ2119309.1 HNH endonuclease [Methylobacterium sp. J-001]
MSESRRKDSAHSKLRQRLAETDDRCIYCDTPVTAETMHIEHMPPIGMFKDQQRLKGMEFAACKSCNNGTRGADTVAAFVARFSPRPGAIDWRLVEAARLRGSLRTTAPGVVEEFERFQEIVVVPGPGGIMRRMLQTRSGPRTDAYLAVFAAKLGMALFREHCGYGIPMIGGMRTAFFLNAGLAFETAKSLVSIMPLDKKLVQGRQHSNPQFIYRYNTDDFSIVFALVQFHEGLYVCVMACADWEIYGGLPFPDLFKRAYPGKLIEMLPPPLTGYRPTASGLVVPRGWRRR